MSKNILRPGDMGFREAFKYAQLYIEERKIREKLEVLCDAAGRQKDYVVIASTNSKIIAIPVTEFEQYYTFKPYDRRYEKNTHAILPYEMTNSSGPKYATGGPIMTPNEVTYYGETVSGRTNAYGKLKETINKENEMIDNKLYVVLDGEHKGKYVNKVAVNSAGHFVVEAKGEAAYFAVAKEHLERVLPYSVDVKFYNNGQMGEKFYSYWAKEGDVEVGDIVFGEYSNAMKVVAINTKSDTANKWLVGSAIKPSKILTDE